MTIKGDEENLEIDFTAKDLEEVLERLSKNLTTGDTFSILLRSGRILNLEVKEVEHTQ